MADITDLPTGVSETEGEAVRNGLTAHQGVDRTGTGKATVVIASAVAESRWRWSRRLEETFAVCEVAERRALEQVAANLKPSVLILDLALPRLRRAHGLPAILHLSPSTKTLVLTDVLADSEGIFALTAGAKGYYTRTIDPGHLKRAVEAIQRGEIWIERKLIQGLVAELVSLSERRQTEPDGPPNDHLESLTGRQRVIADLIGRGACNKEIARRLNITERTVKAHLTETFRQLGVPDRLRLALLLRGYARETGRERADTDTDQGLRAS